jgi:hypothetical protein
LQDRHFSHRRRTFEPSADLPKAAYQDFVVARRDADRDGPVREEANANAKLLQERAAINKPVKQNTNCCKQMG